MNKLISAVAALALFPILGAQQGCDAAAPQDSDTRQRADQERILQEGVAAVGMPAIHNFREKRLLKMILEMRDQEGFTTYTYRVAEYTGKLIPLCDSIGYPIPYSTQFTNPQKVVASQRFTHDQPLTTISQADPNGLFSPAAAEGTWIMCKDPNGKGVHPVYSEPKVITSPFPMKID